MYLDTRGMPYNLFKFEEFNPFQEVVNSRSETLKMDVFDRSV